MITDSSIKQEKIYVSILAAIQIAHIVDFVILMPLGPVFMKDLGITPIEFAGLVSSYNFSATVSALLYSFIADHFDRKTFLILFFIGFIISTFLCGLANTYSLLLGARIFAGAFGGVLNSVIMALVSDLIPIVRRGKAMGVVLSSFSIASVIGVPLGLAICDWYGKSASFYFIAMFSTLILLGSLKLIPSVKIKRDQTDFKSNVLNFKRVLTNIHYIKSYLLIFFMNVSAFVIIPFLSPYAVKNIGILQSELKYLYLFGGIVTIATSRLFGVLTDKVGAYKLFAQLSLFSIIPIIMYTQAKPMSLFWFLLLSALFMSIISGRMIPAWTLVSSVSTNQDRGSFMGIMNSIRSLGSALASLIGGFIILELPDGKIEHFDMVGYVSVLVCFVSIFIGFKIIKNLKEEDHSENTIRSEVSN